MAQMTTVQQPIEMKHFKIKLGERQLIDIDSFPPIAGKSTVIIGPTGSGKSVLLKAISGLLPAGPFTLGGDMVLHGVQAYQGGVKSPYDNWIQIRHKGITFLPAETAQAMNPALSLDQNLKLIAPEARDLVTARLAKYFSLDFKRYAKMYPDEVSGGELQRITLMILLSRKADVVFLDEPTVNLDRQLRQRFIEFLNNEILGKHGKTVLMVSHDLDFVAKLQGLTLYELRGAKLEAINSLPSSSGMEKDQSEEGSKAAITLTGVSQHYKVRGVFGEHESMAYEGVDVEFMPGHIYGITGPSGCGKTSMIKGILRLLDGTNGVIEFEGKDLVSLKPREKGSDPAAFMEFRRKIAIVQQDSRFSFFPDLTIRKSLEEINKTMGNGAAFDEKPILELMKGINLPAKILDAYPKSLSSGEMKRMDIVRVLASKPRVILLDEPFAHIDFETRTKVMEAIKDYVKTTQAILLVVTHEDFDLRHFVQRDYDFLSLVKGQNKVNMSAARA